jgi:hypothetical protein
LNHALAGIDKAGHYRAPMPARLPPDLHELVKRSASVPRGLALLDRAPVEVAAVLFGVHPAAVERARNALRSPELRASAIDEFVRNRVR